VQRHRPFSRLGSERPVGLMYYLGIKAFKKRKNDNSHLHKELFDKYSNYAMSIALRYASKPDEASDIVNDGFLKLFAAYDLDMPPDRIKAIFRRIIINTAIDYYRRDSSRQQHQALHDNIPDDATPNIEQDLSAEEILKALQSLPLLQRLAFTLHEIEGYSHDEIAQKLQINTSTCRSHLRRAKARLQKILQLHERELG